MAQIRQSLAVLSGRFCGRLIVYGYAASLCASPDHLWRERREERIWDMSPGFITCLSRVWASLVGTYNAVHNACDKSELRVMWPLELVFALNAEQKGKELKCSCSLCLSLVWNNRMVRLTLIPQQARSSFRTWRVLTYICNNFNWWAAFTTAQWFPRLQPLYASRTFALSASGWKAASFLAISHLMCSNICCDRNIA